jgi:hypothetical protein
MNNHSALSAPSRKHLLLGLALLTGLLILRFPLLILTDLFIRGQTPWWVPALYYGGTYFLTAWLIWHERDRLATFWIDLPVAITFLCQVFCFPIGIGLFAKMRKSGSRFPKPPAGVWYWALIGPFLAVLLAVGIQLSGMFPAATRLSPPPDWIHLVVTIAMQTTMAAVFEEPLFRGFLWGYMRTAGFRNFWIWLFQALFFTAGHVYYLSSEALGTWFLRMMLPALLIGLIAWGAKSIFASMITHGTFNAVSDMLAHSGSLHDALVISWQALVVLLGILAVLVAVNFIKRRRKVLETP